MLTAIRIVPGYSRSDGFFKANARPKRLEVLINGEHRLEADLEDAPAEQVIPIVGYNKPVERVRLTIKEVYQGARYDDCCISHIGLESALRNKPNLGPL